MLFSKRVKRELSNAYNSLRFVADISKKFKKNTIFDNLRTITQEGDMKTRQITPSF